MINLRIFFIERRRYTSSVRDGLGKTREYKVNFAGIDVVNPCTFSLSQTEPEGRARTRAGDA
jgi:hypothetical protein